MARRLPMPRAATMPQRISSRSSLSPLLSLLLLLAILSLTTTFAAAAAAAATGHEEGPVIRLLEEQEEPTTTGEWAAVGGDKDKAGRFEFRTMGAGAKGYRVSAPESKQVEVEIGVKDVDAAVSIPIPSELDEENKELLAEVEAWVEEMEKMSTDELLDMDVTMISPAQRKNKDSSLSELTTNDGQVVTMGAWGEVINWVSPSPSAEWPFCSPGGFLSLTHTVCPVVYIAARVLVRSPPDFEKLTQEHHCPNAERKLPIDLEELSEKEDGTPVPMMIPRDIVERERATYGWYLTHIYNMYAFAFEYADDLLTDDGVTDLHVMRPMVPRGWENQDVYFMKDPLGWKWPMGQSLTKGDHMVVFFCGTMFPGGWETDFKFVYAEKKDTERRGLPGRCHDGFFDFAEQFFEEFLKEASTHNIKRITFAGHSLGGAIAQIAAAFMVLNHNHLKIDCVVFGSPAVGDHEFTNFLNHKVNLRKMAYLGSGQKDIPAEWGMNYGFGDTITQMPLACYNLTMPYCSLLKFVQNPEGQKSYQFVMAAGNVPFYASDMRNTAGWLKKENYVFGATKLEDIAVGGMACHICSYACWTAMATGDPDDRCFFPEDKGVDQRYLCEVDFRSSLTKRFPALKGPPIDADLIHEGAVAEGHGGDPTQGGAGIGYIGPMRRLREGERKKE